MSWQGSIHDHGFAILREVLSAHDFDSLLTEISEPEVRRSRAGVRHAMRFAAVQVLAKDQRLLGLAQTILGNAIQGNHLRQIFHRELARRLAPGHRLAAEV